MNTPVELFELGQIDYHQAWEIQQHLHQKIVSKEQASCLLLCEHPHVYTLGRQSHQEHLLKSQSEYQALGAQVVEVDRGGDVTYHGPGQIVGYPILKLGDFPCGQDLHRFLRALESVLIATLGCFKLQAQRITGKTGVWVDGEKIAALGLKCSRWVSMHGFALNYAPDLNYFKQIVPCGLDLPVTSMKNLLNPLPDRREVTKKLLTLFEQEFSAQLEERSSHLLVS